MASVHCGGFHADRHSGFKQWSLDQVVEMGDGVRVWFVGEEVETDAVRRSVCLLLPRWKELLRPIM